MKQKLISNGVESEKIEVVVSWYDETVIHEVETNNNEFIKKYNIDCSKKYVQYAGNFGYTFDWKMVLEIAKLLKTRDDIIFHMIGSGTFEKKFKEEVKRNSLKNVIFFPWQPLDIIMDVYSAATIALIPLSKHVLGNSHPSKASLLMACGRTFVCTGRKDSDLINTYNLLKVSIGVADDDPRSAADAVVELIDNLSLRRAYECAAKKHANVELSGTRNTERFLKAIQAVSDGDCI
jgi:glycosyltransferase involved in cell wall biosynthesis